MLLRETERERERERELRHCLQCRTEYIYIQYMIYVVLLLAQTEQADCQWILYVWRQHGGRGDVGVGGGVGGMLVV